MLSAFASKRPLLFILFSLSVLACGGKNKAVSGRKEVLLDRAALAAEALRESAQPIRLGSPGGNEFWNRNASQFIYAPAFDFKPLDGAEKYVFTLRPDSSSSESTFEAAKPWEPLSAVWASLPVGLYRLTVEGVGADGRKIGVAGERSFYRAAPFAGPYGRPKTDYLSCARLGLKSLFDSDIMQNWLKEGKPDSLYSLYCYPSKMIAKAIQGMLLYSTLESADSAAALQVACKAASYLIAASEPSGAPLEFFPPTYDSTHIDTSRVYKNDGDMWNANRAVQKYHGQVMLLYPADVGRAYLDLYDRTGDTLLLAAARGIADTYARIQREDGNWPLKLNLSDGSPVVENMVNPARIIPLLERLEEKHFTGRYAGALEKARANVEKSFESFEFEGQFEDIAPAKRFEDLSHYPATEAARRFLDRAATDPARYIPLALEALSFAEDQFVIWERPLPVPRPGSSGSSKGWFTPCALEQYECYWPVDASASDMIETFSRAYQVTGREIFLAKAVSLANQMTMVQDDSTGLLPTWWSEGDCETVGWINCGIHDAETLVKFAAFTDTLKIVY